MKFAEMALSHRYCVGKGIEIGAAAHNPFNLKDCINVAPKEDESFYRQSQMDMCDEAAKIDLYGYANDIPVEDNSYDYVISSHVLEHVPDAIGAFLEWDRVVRNNGTIFMIVPKRNALKSDIGRPLSCIGDFVAAHKKETAMWANSHVWVFSLNVLTELIGFCNREYGIKWEIIETEETDSKVGNGHTVVCRVHK